MNNGLEQSQVEVYNDADANLVYFFEVLCEETDRGGLSQKVRAASASRSKRFSVGDI